MNNKIRLTILSSIFFIGLLVLLYQSFWQSDDPKIDDKEALSALKWLQNADDGKFEECKKSAGSNVNDWFDLFEINRNTLGKLKERKLKSKAVPKNGIYKVTFNSSFEKAKAIYESVWVDKDAKVWQAKYSYKRLPSPSWKSSDVGSPEEYKGVTNAVNKAISAMKQYNVEFFDMITLRREKFRSGKRIVNNIKKADEKTGKPTKIIVGKRLRFARDFPGCTELVGAIAYATCTYTIKGKPFRRNIAMTIYIDKSRKKPEWQIYSFRYGRLRPVKKRNRNNKKQAGKNAKAKTAKK